MLALASVSDSASQHGYVGTLTAAVGVELVEHQESQPSRCIDQLAALVWTGEQQLEHDVVGQEDVRRRLEDRFAFFSGLLARVPIEGDGLVPDAIAVLKKLF